MWKVPELINLAKVEFHQRIKDEPNLRKAFKHPRVDMLQSIHG